MCGIGPLTHRCLPSVVFAGGRTATMLPVPGLGSQIEEPLLTRAVDVGAVLDAKHGEKMGFVVDLVENAEGAPAGGVDPCELAAQRVADAVRVLQQGSRDELKDCCRDAFRQFVLNGPASTGRHPQSIWLGHRW